MLYMLILYVGGGFNNYTESPKVQNLGTFNSIGLCHKAGVETVNMLGNERRNVYSRFICIEQGNK